MQSFTTSAIMSQSLVSESEIFKSSAKMNANKENINCSVNKKTFLQSI